MSLEQIFERTECWCSTNVRRQTVPRRRTGDAECPIPETSSGTRVKWLCIKAVDRIALVSNCCQSILLDTLSPVCMDTLATESTVSATKLTVSATVDFVAELSLVSATDDFVCTGLNSYSRICSAPNTISPKVHYTVTTSKTRRSVPTISGRR